MKTLEQDRDMKQGECDLPIHSFLAKPANGHGVCIERGTSNKHVVVSLRRQQLSGGRVAAEGAGELGQEAIFCQVPTEVLHMSSPHLTRKSWILKFLTLRVELHKRKVLEQSALEEERRYEDLRQKKVALDQTFERVKAQLLVRIFAAIPSSLRQQGACNCLSFH